MRSLDPGRLDGVSLVAAPELSEPLAPGHVRVSVRAAGMNFRDVLIALGQIESPGIGFEFAGVVEAVGADVTSVCGWRSSVWTWARVLWNASGDAGAPGGEGSGGDVV